MKIKTCGFFGKLEHFIGRFFNIMALIRTIGVIIVMWSLVSSCGMFKWRHHFTIPKERNQEFYLTGDKMKHLGSMEELHGEWNTIYRTIPKTTNKNEK